VFVDFEKAFDSLHRDSLWKILRHYGIPLTLVNIIQLLYQNFECRVLYNNKLTEPFEVKTGVKQGCILSPILFSLANDWIMRNVTDGRRQGLQWTLTSVLEDLDYADDLGLLSHRHQDIQQKTDLLNTTASTVGLRVNAKKTKVLRLNSNNTEPISIVGRPLENVEEFAYLGSIRRMWQGNRHQDKQSKPGFCYAKARLDIYNHQYTHQDTDLQQQRSQCAPVWFRVLEDHCNHWQEAWSLPEQVTTTNPQDLLA